MLFILRKSLKEPLKNVASGWLVVAAGAEEAECTRVHEHSEHRRPPPGARAVVFLRFLNSTLRFLASALLLCACAAYAQAQQNPKADTDQLLVYKHPLCFCCKKWIKHLEQNGLQARSINTTDTTKIKAQWQVPNGMQSCHTAVWQGKYVFEGHVPARYIRQYLQNPPENSIGLTVPGMPEGSPGMHDGGEFIPYNIYLLQADGDYRFFAKVETPDQ